MLPHCDGDLRIIRSLALSCERAKEHGVGPTKIIQPGIVLFSILNERRPRDNRQGTHGYEAMILTPEQAYTVFRNLRDPERTLTLLAAGTGLRISECLGLQWQDVSFADAMIHVRRTWTCGQVGLPKTKASKGPVPLHPLLAEFMLRWKEQTAYSEPSDWVFAS